MEKRKVSKAVQNILEVLAQGGYVQTGWYHDNLHNVAGVRLRTVQDRIIVQLRDTRLIKTEHTPGRPTTYRITLNEAGRAYIGLLVDGNGDELTQPDAAPLNSARIEAETRRNADAENVPARQPKGLQ